MKGQKLITEALTCPGYTSISDYYGIFLVILEVCSDGLISFTLSSCNINLPLDQQVRNRRDFSIIGNRNGIWNQEQKI